ncbi:MAG: glycosyltransferase family 4 protein [Candidatus Jordarchaeales archaeon]
MIHERFCCVIDEVEEGQEVILIKILVFNWRDILNPEAGGAEVHLHEIFKRISYMGHEVVVISSRFNGCKNHEKINGVKIYRVGGKFLYGVIVPLYYLLKLRKDRFDVVIDDISKAPLFTPLYVRKPLIAIVHHFHGLTLFKELPFLLALPLYILEKMIPLIYKRTPFVTVSESTKHELASYHIKREQIAVIYNGVNLHCSIGKKAEKPLVVYVGRVKRYKQLNHLIEAFKGVKQKVPEAKLVIAGKGDAHEELIELAKKIGVEFTCIREISEEEKVRLLQKAWVYVTTSMKEGWGISVIEANACGTPVVAYDVAGLREAVKNGKTGYLVTYGDIKELTGKITDILLNHQLRQEMSRNAVEWAKKFDWQAASTKMLKIIYAITRKS